MKAADLLDFDRAYDLIEERSENFENGLADLGFLTKFRKRVLTQVSTPDAANLLRIFEKSPLTYFAWECPNDRTVSNVSTNVAKNFGYGPNDFLNGGKSFVDLIYPDDFMRVQREIYENVDQKKLPEYDLYYRILHSDGRVRFVHDHTHVVYDESGRAIQSFGFVFDVTEREETRMMLDDYVRAIDQSAIVQIVDKDGIIRYANDLYRKLSGDERDVVGKPVRMLGGKKYQDDEFWKGLWTTVLAGKVWSGVVQNPVPKQGSDESYYTHTTITPLQNAKGEYDRFIAIKFDITRLKEVESALRRTNARFEKILDSTSQGFWSIDADLNVREVNASFCSLLGYEEDEIVGKNVRDFLDARNIEILEKKSSTMMTTEHRSYDVEFLTKDGVPVPVSILATTIRDENGVFQEAIAFISDATE
ncbi:MAG: PAS domain S-box protein, partial [Patescibacteria group bacterium]